MKRILAETSLSQLALFRSIQPPSAAELPYRLQPERGRRNADSPKYELHDLTFKFELFADVVCRTVGVMRVCDGAREQSCCSYQEDQSSLMLCPLRLL